MDSQYKSDHEQIQRNQKQDILHSKNKQSYKQQKIYICFCQRNYRSYPALYLHLKNKHQQYFKSIRSKKGQKKSQPTKLVHQGSNIQTGLKTYRLMLQQKAQKGIKNNNQAQSSSPDKLNSQQFQVQSCNIERAFQKFIDNYKFSSPRYKYQIQCLNQNYLLLSDTRIKQECVRYTNTYDCKYINNIFNYFIQIFIPSIKIDQNNQFFFQKSIIKTNLKQFLEEVFNFVKKYCIVQTQSQFDQQLNQYQGQQIQENS